MFYKLKSFVQILDLPATIKVKISAQPNPTLYIQFLNRENNDKNITLPLGKQICFTIVWGCVEILPYQDLLEAINC